MTIDSPLNNTGKLIGWASTLTVDGAVTGSGIGEVNTGTLILEKAFNQNVTFLSATAGVLELGVSKGYTTGSITGLSKTGANSLDLLDIAYAGTKTAVYSGTATSGVLTVTEGANVVKIHLTGDYLGSTFSLSAGPAGSTKVVDPAKSAPPHASAPLHGFIAAMAGFGAEHDAGQLGMSAEAWRPPPSTLAMARPQIS